MLNILEQFYQLYTTHPFYYANYADKDAEAKFYRHKVCVSGRGSGKTTNIALSLLILGAQTKIKVLCVREIQNSIQDSVHKVLKEIIEDNKALSNFFKVTDKNIKGLNGTEFIFKGLYNNLTSIKGIQGIDICWVEEAESVSQAAIDVLEPTIRKEHSEIWWSFNPRFTDDPVYTMFIIDKEGNKVVRDDMLLITASYKENAFLSQTIIDDVNRMIQRDYNKYLHVYEGHLKTQTEASIFANKWRIDIMDENVFKDKGITPRYGIDWGFSNDPNAVVRQYLDEKEKIIYITHAKYAYHTELDHIPNFLRTIPGIQDNIIRADKSRPETISYCRRNGFPLMCHSLNKKIEEGITFLLNYDLIVHPSCVDFIEECKKYSYKVNKQTGEITNIIGETDNHCVIGNTLVNTNRGVIKIKDIKKGDMVLTRHGYKKVNKVYNNGYKNTVVFNTISGRQLESTANHKYFINDSFNSVDSISLFDIVIVTKEKGKKTWVNKLYSTVSNIAGMLKAINLLRNAISDHHHQKESTGIFIEQFGKIKMVKFLKDIIYTTKTVTKGIILLKILNVYLQKNIKENMKLGEVEKKKTKNTCIKYKISLENGIEAKKEENGTNNIAKIKLPIEFLKTLYVNIVEKIIKLKLKVQNFVLVLASRLIDEKWDLTTKIEHVNTVAQSLQHQSIVKQNFAVDLALTITDGELKEVFDIEVEEKHEYFANEILIHNCFDALRYTVDDLVGGGARNVKISGW